VASKEEINARLAWVKQPDCLTCHEDFEKPAAVVTSYNVWNEDFSELYRIRTDYAGVRCEACHGATHAEYPASNAFGVNRDNIQPLQYQGEPYPIGSNFSCEVCHMQEMEFPVHHENMMRNFRNTITVQ
jgi:hypothetical protein